MKIILSREMENNAYLERKIRRYELMHDLQEASTFSKTYPW